MKQTLFILLLLTLSSLYAGAQKPNESKATTKESKGLFNVTKQGEDYYFSIADSLIGRRFLVTVRFTSTPAGTGKFAGEMANEQTVYWEKAPGNRLLLRSDMFINAADSLDLINRAVVISNSNPIIGTFNIEKGSPKHSKIKVTQFFNEDNNALGVERRTKSSFGLQGYLPQASYIESIKTFPLNTEIRTVKTWMSHTTANYAAAATGKVTLGLNISFVLLPKVPMMPRLFDPRIGYFTDSYTYFSDNQQAVQTRRFITRYRLEPKNSADAEKMKRGELVEPKKPIIYYIDPATPKQWRKYLIQGVDDWQKAFEKAGFKNAIMGKEWPENDSTMSMEDARFSVIRYLASPIPNAYGPQVHDPRSGEILESHICWYHNVMSLVHDWYMVQSGCIDPEARTPKFSEELMGQLIRFVSSHEVGHSLGLRHNFGSSSLVPVDSLRSKAWVEKYGHTPSIMDYARFNYVAQPEDSISRAGIFPRINDYDIWAIQWGYTPMWNAYDADSDHWELEKMTASALAGNPRLWFGDGETNPTNDSRCQTEDLGDDAVKAGDYGIKNLKRILPQLPEWTYQSNDIHEAGLSGMYEQTTGQFLRYLHHALGYIGGVYHNYKTIDEPGDIYTYAPRCKQKDAVDFIGRHVFNEPRWLIDLPYIHRLHPTPQALTTRIGKSIVEKMLGIAELRHLSPEYPLDEYLADMTRLLLREVRTGECVQPYRRELQLSYVVGLAALAAKSSPTMPQRASFLAAVHNIEKSLRAIRPSDVATLNHYAALLDAIERTLAVK